MHAAFGVSLPAIFAKLEVADRAEAGLVARAAVPGEQAELTVDRQYRAPG